MKRIRKILESILVVLFFVGPFPVFANGNPYYGGWSNCTWGAWELANQNGTSLPSLGNAGSWLQNAIAYGYSTGSTPASNAIGVYSNHVVYVASYEGGDTMYIQEGGYNGGYHEETISAYSGRHGQALLGFIYLGGVQPYAQENTWEENVVEDIYYDTYSEAENVIQEYVQEESVEESYIEEINSSEKYVEVFPGITVAISEEASKQLKKEETNVFFAMESETLKQEEKDAINDVRLEDKNILAVKK